MIKPKSEDELAAAIAETTGPLRIRGGNTRTIGHDVIGTDLSVSGLSGIKLYEPGSLTLVAGAGTPVADIEKALNKHGQRLAFEPMDHRTLLGTKGVPTIGGVTAANVSGPRRVQAGACRDYLLGVRFVDGSAKVIKNGGRVMKNVTGYDLTKLMAGSYGTLGVLSEVAFKVLPTPELTASLQISDLTDANAQKAMSKAIGSPFEITGAAHLPAYEGQQATTMLRIEGFKDSVAYRATELSELLQEFGDVSVNTDPTETVQKWKSIRDVERFQNRTGDVWKISVRPSDGPGIGKKAKADDLLYDWAGGLVWALVPEGTDLRKSLGKFSGHATLVRATSQTRAALPVFRPESAPLAKIASGLRARFDPKNILNTGLMGS